MVTRIGGTFGYYSKSKGEKTNPKTDCKRNMMIRSKFNDIYGNTTEYTTTIFNGDTTYEYTGESSTNEHRFTSEQKEIFEKIIGFDGNKNDFSEEDIKNLTKQQNNYVSIPGGYKYQVVYNEGNGVIEIQVRDDKSHRVKELDLTIDLETDSEKAQREQEEYVALYRTRDEKNANAEGLKKEFEEKFTNEYEIDVMQATTSEENAYIKVTLKQNTTLGEIKKNLNVPDGVLLRENPTLKNLPHERTFWNKLFNNYNYDNIEAPAETVIKIPACELNNKNE